MGVSASVADSANFSELRCLKALLYFTTEVVMMNETNQHWRSEILHMIHEICCRINFIICNKTGIIYHF